MKQLANKRILLGMTGGIAAYKCAELTRLFTRLGADVRVVMTRAATGFMTPLTMQALSGNRVHLDLLDAEAEAGMGHIELARWPDLILVAPASADFIARMAQGHAADLLSTLLLATRAPVAVAPAMNQAMWEDPGTQRNVEQLRQQGCRIFGPGAGDQACGETGPGRMLEPAQLLERTADEFQSGLLDGVRVTITAGPTREAIDPVRYLSNHSSGKMGYALAEQAAGEGARVTLISGPVALTPPDRVHCLQVISAEEMLQAALEQSHDCDVFIGAAAIADYRPEACSAEKIRKGAETMTLKLVRNPDIITTVAGGEHRPLMVGFAAETSRITEHGRDKLERKGLDLLFANEAVSTFDRDSIDATALWADGEQRLGPASKTATARRMLQLISEHLAGADD